MMFMLMLKMMLMAVSCFSLLWCVHTMGGYPRTVKTTASCLAGPGPGV